MTLFNSASSPERGDIRPVGPEGIRESIFRARNAIVANGVNNLERAAWKAQNEAIPKQPDYSFISAQNVGATVVDMASYRDTQPAVADETDAVTAARMRVQEAHNAQEAA